MPVSPSPLLGDLPRPQSQMVKRRRDGGGEDNGEVILMPMKAEKRTTRKETSHFVRFPPTTENKGVQQNGKPAKKASRGERCILPFSSPHPCRIYLAAPPMRIFPSTSMRTADDSPWHSFFFIPFLRLILDSLSLRFSSSPLSSIRLRWLDNDDDDA